MNLIILAVEHCACSWLGAYITEAYKRATGKTVHWNYEISRMIAIDPRYNLPVGFSSVYYVKLEWLLERDYDKIIVLKRSYEAFENKLLSDYNIKKNVAIARYPKWLERMRFYYDLVYDYNTDDPRVFEVSLDDLNNYTVATFSELFDFLELEFEFRPFIIVPKRDYEKYGSVLKKGHEEGTATKNKYSQYVNKELINPYKIAPEEYWHQEARVFRLEPKGMPDVLEYMEVI